MKAFSLFTVRDVSELPPATVSCLAMEMSDVHGAPYRSLTVLYLDISLPLEKREKEFITGAKFISALVCLMLCYVQMICG